MPKGPLLLVLLAMLLAGACTERAPAPSAVAHPSAPHAFQDTTPISTYIRCLFRDRDGVLWLGTESDGAVRYDGHGLTYFTTTDGLAGTAVRAIVQDAQGGLWFGGRGGLSRFDGKAFQRFTTKEGLASNEVWSLLLDRDGLLWCGTDGGVSRFDGKVFRPFPLPAADLSAHPDAFPVPRLISSIAQDRAGNIWFGSNGNGAFRYDGKALRNFTRKDGLCDDFVQCILQDRQNAVWFGTRYGGVCLYDGEGFATFSTKEGLGTDFVWTMAQDRRGLLWYGTVGAGLCGYNALRFRCFGQAEGLTNAHVQSILEDTDGALWVGTSGGLFRFDGHRCTPFTRADAGGATPP